MNQKVKGATGSHAAVVGLMLATVLGVAVARGASVTLAWLAPPGEALRYRLYSGGTSRVYTNRIDAGTNLTATVSNLVNGATYYFTATSYSPDGVESDYSNELTYRLAPQPPVLQAEQVVLEVPVSFWSATNLSHPNWQALGNASAWLVVPATKEAEFFFATSSVTPGRRLGLTIQRATNQ